MRILHIIPRWIGGGPERHVLELARHDGDRPLPIERRVLVLDRPISAPLLVRARRLGMAVVGEPWTEAVDREVADADVVDITFWNHPALLELLRRPLPAARIIIRAAVAGDTLPQVIAPDLVPFPDAWVLSAPPGYGAQHVAAGHADVVHVPSLADMSRLDGFTPVDHGGLRAVHLGNLTTAKLHPDFARSIALVTHHDVMFSLYGDADPLTLARLSAQLQAHGVADRVTLHGHVERIVDALATATMFVHPLAANGYATSEKALQEAMWVGIPPIVLEGTAAVGWVESEVTGLVAADVTMFAAHIDRLVRDVTLRRRLGDAARRFARVRFDPRRNAATLWEVVERRIAVGKRSRDPLPHADASPSDRFLHSLGDLAGDFQRRLAEPNVRADALLLRGEGGVLHHRNASSHDSRLDAWVGALLAAEMIEAEREAMGQAQPHRR